MIRNLVLLISLLFALSQNGFGQDVWLQNYFAPTGGCELSSTQAVNVLINNNSGVFIPGNSISVNFTVDGAGLTTELLSVGLAPGASWNFTFTGTADLSACGSHAMKTWVAYGPDAIKTNDTLQWLVQNDCTVIPGSVGIDATVCEGVNSGTLNLSGWTYGTIAKWESSTNGGVSWSPIANTTTSENYLNLITTTNYRVVIDGGFCVDDTSTIATISVDPTPIGGSLASTTHCVSNVNGTLNLVGESGTINFWEYSDNAGVSWSNIPNTTNSEPYSGFVSDRWYRVQIEGNTCPDVYSSVAIIAVDQLSVGGTTQFDQTICENTSTTVDLVGETGTILDWESSDDLATWNPMSLTTNTISTPVLTSTTYYRSLVKNGVCPNDTSSIVTVTVENQSVGGTLGLDQNLCETNPNGTLNLSGYSGPITNWEFSTDDGATWNSIANATATENFAGLTDTTWYRVFFDGMACSDAYSDTAIVNVDGISVGGTVTSDQVLCSPASTTVDLTGYTGTIIDWESSSDLVAWTSVGTNTVSYSTPVLSADIYYRVRVQNGSCQEDTANYVSLILEQPTVGGTITGSTDLCASVASGALNLVGAVGNIDHWEYTMDNGATWISVPNTTTTYNYSLLTDTTWFRVFINGVSCADSYSDTAIVNVIPEPTTGVLSANAIICEGESVNLSLTGYDASTINWEWSQDFVTWNPLVSGVDVYSVTPGVSTFYRVVMTKGICGPVISNQVNIVVNPAPVVSAGADLSLILGDSVTLSGFGGVFGYWSPSLGLSNPNSANPFAFPTETTTYTYTVISGLGCQASDSMVVTVNLPNGVDIKNVITANGDGYNDVWFIEDVEKYPLTEVHVFSIYGEEVYSSMDYQNDWDGSYKDELLPNGTYYYLVKLQGENELRKGTLTILGNE